MKKLTTSGLLFVAVAALMATVGASTASATETSLCKVKETEPSGITRCKKENTYPAATAIHAELEGPELVIETPIAKVECGLSTISATTEQETSIPLGATITVFTIGGCTNNAQVKVLVNGTLDIELIDLPDWTHDGTLEFTETVIEVSRFGVKCIYEPGHAGILTGGTPATIDLTGKLKLLAGSSVLCGSGPGSWKGSYVVTKPEPLWVSM